MMLPRSPHVALSLSCVLLGCLTGAQAFERNSTELCTTLNGYYGDLRGEPRLVAFEYTVALSNDTTEEDFVENILPVSCTICMCSSYALQTVSDFLFGYCILLNLGAGSFYERCSCTYAL